MRVHDWPLTARDGGPVGLNGQGESHGNHDLANLR